MAKFRMFRATDLRDNKREIFIIRDYKDVAVVHGNTLPADAKRMAIIGALAWGDLAYHAKHIGSDHEEIQEWEIDL